MNKIHRILLAALLAISVNACDQAEPELEATAASVSEPTEPPVSSDSEPEQEITTADGQYKVGDRLEPAVTEKTEQSDARTLEWDDLIPKDYDPMVLLEGVDLDAMQDGDPRADELLAELKAAWSDAPAVEALNGQKVRLPGFAVPLEGDEKNVNELLLVPYFGACIHVPPPPSNQIVHVFPNSPVEQEMLYDAIWIEGTIKVESSHTKSGNAGYTFTANSIEPYE